MELSTEPSFEKICENRTTEEIKEIVKYIYDTFDKALTLKIDPMIYNIIYRWDWIEEIATHLTLLQIKHLICKAKKLSEIHYCGLYGIEDFFNVELCIIEVCSARFKEFPKLEYNLIIDAIDNNDKNICYSFEGNVMEIDNKTMYTYAKHGTIIIGKERNHVYYNHGNTNDFLLINNIRMQGKLHYCIPTTVTQYIKHPWTFYKNLLADEHNNISLVELYHHDCAINFIQQYTQYKESNNYFIDDKYLYNFDYITNYVGVFNF